MSNQASYFYLDTDDIGRANALFNAVKKQYGLNTAFIRLTLPSPPPPPVSIPAPPPRLSNSIQQDSSASNHEYTAMSTPQDARENGIGEPGGLIRMCDSDIQATAQFVRDFITMGLIPWMEKCVVDWNEAVNTVLFS